jgi:hypothetical protein
VTFSDSAFYQVYAGHFHLHQRVGTAVRYVGSILPFKFDEGDHPHGFLVYDTTIGEEEFVDIWEAARQLGRPEPYPPQFHTVFLDALGNLDSTKLANNRIRVTLSTGLSPQERKDYRETLIRDGARDVVFAELLRVEPTTITVPTLEPLSAEQLFLAWTEQQELPEDLNPALLVRLNQEILKEGDELFELSQQPDQSQN